MPTQYAGAVEESELYSYALSALAARDLPEAQLRNKLAKKGAASDVERVVQKLKAKKFLDDNRYAENFAKYSSAKWGRHKIRMELKKKGVAESIIEKALAALESESSPVDEAFSLLERYRTRYQGAKPKAIRFLVGRGFSIAEALEAWDRLSKG